MGRYDLTASAEPLDATWYTPDVPKKRMKELMRRSDGPSLRHFAIWGVLLLASAGGAIGTWGSWGCVPFFLAYGVLWTMSTHHAHDLSHGTPFRTRRLGEFLYHINAFMALHEAEYWRWSHARHHSETLVTGRDPEIAAMAPPNLFKAAVDFFFLWSGIMLLRGIFRHAAGHLGEAEKTFIPQEERWKIVRTARVYVAIMAATVLAAALLQSWLPLLLVTTPRFYGGFMAQFFALTQHAGLQENVADHRLNCRTFHANPVFEFLYFNMNWHVEHHIFPMVPWYNLRALHDEIRDQCAPPYPSVWACWKEMIPALLRQRRDPSYFVPRAVPVAQPAMAAE